MDVETREVPPLTFERLVGELHGPLFRYLRRMLGNSADADDLLQDVLMRIASGLPDLENRAAVTSWAFRIATNVAIDHIRAKKRARLVEFDEGDEPGEVQGDERLVLDEMNACVREVIDRLPPDHRAAIVLFHIEGRSIAETAEILGISTGATRVRIHRARKRLKEALDSECTFYATPDGTTRCDRKAPPADV